MEITPFENDTKLAALFGEASKHRQYLASAQSSLKATNRDGSPRYSGINREQMEIQVEKHTAALETLAALMAPYEAEYAARRWSRFFLVTNGNGHVHSSMHCKTCYATTEFAWLPELSGKTEDDAVDEFGEKMCTVCFPSAPANPKFNAPGRRDREALDAKAAEKDAKLAAKLEKALLPDGSELRLTDPYDRPKTLIAAQRMLSSKLTDAAMDRLMVAAGHRAYNRKGEAEDIEALAVAISNKTGEGVDSILETAKAKAEKSAKKRMAESEAYAKQMGWS